jgi:insecticidal toxin complex protein TccC
MSTRYTSRHKDPKFPVVKTWKEQSTNINLSDLGREVPPIHQDIQNRIKEHIVQSNGYLPQGAGLPGAHAEVQAGSFALYIQHQATGKTAPAVIEVVTQRLQNVDAAKEFPACFNCTGALLESYNGTFIPFGVLTGQTKLNRETWNEKVEPFIPRQQ